MSFFHLLLSGFGVLWVALAMRPHDRTVWVAENALTVLAVLAMLWTYPTWPLSDLSYALIFAFLVLHTIGGHYTYVRVPYGSLVMAAFGVESGTQGWMRNHYDRLVHLSYGLLVAYPLFEMLERYAQPGGWWSYALSPALIIATSALFEIIEWWAAALLGKGSGAAYLGAQGDEWDAQKDMGLATLGSLIAMAVTAWIL